MTKLIKLGEDEFIVKDTGKDSYVRGCEEQAREALEYAGVNMSDIEQAFDIFDSTDDDYADFGVRGSLIYTVTMDSEDYNRYYYE